MFNIILFLYSVLGQVEFEKHFKDLPKYVPDEATATTPLLQSPRGILNAYKSKGKMTGLGEFSHQYINVVVIIL